MTINKITGYNTSSDYDRLVEIMVKQSVICLVEFGESGQLDIAKTSYCSETGIYQILTRGTCYIYASDVASFLRDCKLQRVEFIEPVKLDLKEAVN
jgi:hypothetical protein